jgi:hypothetical protein
VLDHLFEGQQEDANMKKPVVFGHAPSIFKRYFT